MSAGPAITVEARVRSLAVRVTVIVPVLYRELQLERTLSHLARLRPDLDLEILVVVDVPDPSREAEARDANEGVAGPCGARAVYRVGQRGFGSALRLGFTEARGDVMVPFMGDESDRPEDIPLMVRELERGLDVVAGSRYMRGGKTVGVTTKQRLSHLYSILVRLAGGPNIHDVSNAFKAYRRQVVESVPTEADSFDISVELTVKAALAGFRVGEIPTEWTNRQLGGSNFRVGRELSNYRRWLLLAARGRLRPGNARRGTAPAPGSER